MGCNRSDITTAISSTADYIQDLVTEIIQTVSNTSSNKRL